MEGVPGVRTGLQKEGDVTGGSVVGGHANDEADHSDQDGANNVPEL